jgi:methyl-accepting chemotaxis protein
MSKRLELDMAAEIATLVQFSGEVEERAVALARTDPGAFRELQHALLGSHAAHAEVHAVLDAQVKGAIDTANSLVDAVVREANKTHIAAVDLVGYMSEASKLADDAFARVHAAIEDTNHERVNLEHHAQLLRDATSTTRKMLEEQKRLESIGEHAHNLGMRIRIVAMNTTIQATQGASSGGGTIAVLAREISNLASEVQKLGLELKETVHTLSVHLDRDVVHGVSQEATATADISATLANHVQSLRDAYANLQGFRDNVWSQVTAASRQVSQHACDTLGGLQYQDIARQRLEQVSQVLARIISSDSALTAALLGEAPLPHDWEPVHARKLLEGYVMDSQRRAHGHRSTIEPEAAEGPAIELF